MVRIRTNCAARLCGVGGWLIVICCGIAQAGCNSDDSLAGIGLEVRPPSSWRPADPAARMVPGIPMAAWLGPRDASLVVYRSLPIPGGTPNSIAASMVNRLMNLPGLDIKAQRVESVGGRPVARVEIVGPGTAEGLAPSSIGKPMPPPGQSLISTREIVMGFPETEATYYLRWTFPESAREQLLPEIDETVSSLRLPAGTVGSKTSY